MSTNTTAGGRVDVPGPPADLSSALGDFVDALLAYGGAKLSRGVEQGLGGLEQAMLSRGPFERAVYEAGKARLQGKNPVWAGAKGAWAGASVPQRFAAVAILVLLLVLAPVSLLVLLIGLLVAALAAAIRSANRSK
jgi:hypothetical protein